MSSPTDDVLTPTSRALRQCQSQPLKPFEPLSATFVPGTQLFATGGKDKTLTLHSLEDPNVQTVVVRRPGSVYAVTATLDGAAVAAGDNTGWVSVYDVAQSMAAAAAELIVPLGEVADASSTSVLALRFSGVNNSERLLVLCQNGGVQVRVARSVGLPLLATLAFRGGAGFGTSSLSCAGALVAAVGGGYATGNGRSDDDPDSGRLRVWNLMDSGGIPLDDSTTPICALDLVVNANSVSIHPSGARLAVGLGDGAVLVVEELARGGVKRGQLEEPSDRTQVNSLAYSPDGLLLVAGRASGVFTVYEVGSAAAVARFEQAAALPLAHSVCQGMIAVWAPAGDVVAVGGFASEQVSLREVRPPASFATLTMSKPNDVSDLCGAAVSAGGVTALASGARLEVRDVGGRRLVDVDVGAPIGAYCDMHTPVAIRADGLQVACALDNGKIVSVRSVPGGEEAFVVGPWPGGKADQVCWSPDGRYFAVASSVGAFVYDALGVELCALSDNSKHVFSCTFDSSSSLLASCSADKRVRVRSTNDWAVTHTLPQESAAVCTVCLDAAGKRVAFWVNTEGAGTVVVRSLDDDDSNCSGPPGRLNTLSVFLYKSVLYGVFVWAHRALNNQKRRFLARAGKRVEGHNAFGSLAFSPDGRLLACGGTSLKTGKHFTLLSADTGKEWLPALRYMALPAGSIRGQTVEWAPSSSTSADTPCVLYAAFGSRFVKADLRLAEQAIEDNAWSAEQLIELSDRSPETLQSLVAAAPHLINIRHATTGDTVMHHLARERKADTIDALLETQTCVVTPICNAEALSVLFLAIEIQEKQIAKALWRRMTPSLNYMSSPLVTKELRHLARTIPEMVLPFLLDVEGSIFKTVTTFRAPLHRQEEVCGLETESLPLEADEKMSAVMSAVPAVWAGLLPGTESGKGTVLVASQVVMLAHFLGEPELSPFHSIVHECSALVFESKLMRLAVQFKWETSVWPKMKLLIAGYGCALVLATAATLMSSRMGGSEPSSDERRLLNAVPKKSSEEELGGSSGGTEFGGSQQTTITVLVAAMMGVECLSLCNELRQLVRMGLRAYFSPWNVLDSSSSILLLVGATAHFAGNTEGVCIYGAFGVALKWLGFVDFLRCFGNTGSLVRMVEVIIVDIGPFLILLAISLLAAVFYFAIADPLSDAFAFDTDNGVLWPIQTGFLAMLGAEEELKKTFEEELKMLCLFLFFVVVVMLNLLIAIMGDSCECLRCILSCYSF
jgi:WD40 repeat protein